MVFFNEETRTELKIIKVLTQRFDDEAYIDESYHYELYDTRNDYAVASAPTLEKLFRNILNGWAD